MKTLGVIRRVDQLGRIVIPKEIRNEFDGDMVAVDLLNDEVIGIRNTKDASWRYTRRLDKLGRIVIPKEIRKRLNVKDKNIEDGEKGTPFELFIEEGTIYLKKFEHGCYCCGEVATGLIDVLGRKLCPKCLEEHRKALEVLEGKRNARVKK